MSREHEWAKQDSHGAHQARPKSSRKAEAVDRALQKTTEEAGRRKGYDTDARAIAEVMVRHFGDEAEAVLDRAKEMLDAVRRTKR